MNPTFTFLFISLIHFSILFHSVLPNSVERVALLEIKSQITHDPHGVLDSWNESLPICEWHGVFCGTKHPHRVVGLNLEHNDLVGTLSPYVGNLSFLHDLLLTNNTFGGHIPPQLGNLVKLRSLGLENNTFEGQIPANISRCLNLEALGLALNHLSGIIPSQLGLLSNLKFLTLFSNQLEGDLLNKVVINMTSLQVLFASYNSFYGSIPDSIGATHKYLRYFAIINCSISGTIPPSFYNLSQLQQVGLAFNQLQGTLPFDIGVRLPKLTKFIISANFFHGKLPVSLANLTHLEIFGVSFNNFIGNMFSGRNMPNLAILEIDHNNLGTGRENDLDFLQTLVNCSKLQELECGVNNFGGMLPESLGNLSTTTLTSIDFSNNKIYGSIPSGLYNLVNLRILGLQSNQLCGHITPQIEKLTRLETLNMDSNYLTGNLPHSWGNLSHLGQLYLANNRFQGRIPSSLDVSQNTLSGELPTTLGSCNELVELDMGGNLFTGYIPQSFKSLTSLNFLNLSHNKLSGPIPLFFENFPLVGLDLSFNNFEGEVPRKGVFANLSALIIRGNTKLCGGIPELHLPTCPPSNDSKGKGSKLSVAVVVIIVLASLVASVSIVALVYFLLCSRRKRNKPSQGSESNLIEPFSKISYDMLLKATDGFSEANLLGVGHFGSVYKGVLDHQESNMVVAVKVISLQQRGATKSFMAECEALRSIRHRNLLKIVTVCSSTDFQGNDFKALVYEFMTNGSLHQWIHTDTNLRTLSLLQRVVIAIDVANALDYLHNGCDTPIIHCDLKPSNILLDDSMVAHVGDFGLARFHLRATENNSSSIAVKGTVGYAAPEYGLGSIVSKEGDIYSFGIVLLEMMTSKNPTDEMFERGLDLHSYANSAALSDQLVNIIDPRLLEDGGTSEGNEGEIFTEIDRKHKCIKSIIEIGVKCSVESPQDRMRIEDAIGELQVLKDALLKQLHVIRAKRA